MEADHLLVTARTTVDAGRTAALRSPLGVAALAAAAVGVVATVDPNEPGHYPACPLLALTGAFCPGCGSLRAVHAMAHGDLITAVGLNVLTVLAVLPLGVVWLQWVRRSWTGRPKSSLAPAAALWALTALIIGFGVLRNLPMGAVLAP